MVRSLIHTTGPSPKITPRDMSNFLWPYIRNGWSDPLYIKVGYSGSAYRMALFPVQSNPRWRPYHKLTTWQMISTRAEQCRLMPKYFGPYIPSHAMYCIGQTIMLTKNVMCNFWNRNILHSRRLNWKTSILPIFDLLFGLSFDLSLTAVAQTIVSIVMSDSPLTVLT